MYFRKSPWTELSPDRITTATRKYFIDFIHFNFLIFIFISVLNRITNDIALLRLSQDVVFSAKIVPACLPTNPALTYAGQSSITSGKKDSGHIKQKEIFL